MLGNTLPKRDWDNGSGAKNKDQYREKKGLFSKLPSSHSLGDNRRRR
jgi:hypothetical protein